MQQDIYDPLLDEGKAFSDRLDAAGVPVLYECFEGMAHGFLIMGSARVNFKPDPGRLLLPTRRSCVLEYARPANWSFRKLHL